jgi:hypothetical protein
MSNNRYGFTKSGKLNLKNENAKNRHSTNGDKPGAYDISFV